MLQDCGDSERTDLLWTMTSWAAPYVSTTRRASSASLMCLRDWCTSSFTQYEAAAGWEDKRKRRRRWEPAKLQGNTISPCTSTLKPEMIRWQETRALANPNGTHFHCQHWSNSWQLVREGLFVHAWEDGTKQSGCCGFFFFCCRIKQPQIKKQKLPCHLHDLPVYFPQWDSKLSFT